MKKKVTIISIFSILLIGIFALPVGAQSPVTATVDRNQLSTDEILILTVTIDTGAGQASQPDLSSLDGFELLGSSKGTQISITNGNMSTQARYSYSLHPVQSGQLVINPISVQINGQVHSTQPITVAVSQGTGQVQPAPNQGIPSMPGFPTRPNMPNLNNLFQGMPSAPSNAPSQAQPVNPADAPTELDGQNFFIEAEVDNPNPYQGEQVIYTFRFYQAENLFDQPSYESPSFTGFWSEEQADQQTDYTTEAAGRAYRVTELQTVLFPTIVGDVTIDPAKLTIPGDFFSRGMALYTQPVTMTVKPLPENAPHNFQGAVGQFEIQAQSDTAATEVNETVTQYVTLSGQGNLQGIADPQWPEDSAWRAFDSKATVDSYFADGVMSGVRSYERLLVPTQPGDLLLTAIEFSFFNPQTESYETVSSQPIIVTVTGEIGSGVTPITPDGGVGSTVNAARTAPIIPEFRPNKPAAELGHNSGGSLLKNTGYWILWLLPLALIVGSYGVGRYKQQRMDTADVRRSHTATKRAKQSLREARKKPETESINDVERILYQYLEEKLNISITGQTQTELSHILTEAGIEPALIERVQTCLMLSEMGRYAPSGIKTGNSNLMSEAEQVIAELEKGLSRG